MQIPFVGPSYSLTTYKASAQRSVNMHLVGMETPSKAPFILDAVPGLAVFCDMGSPIRGSIDANGRCFVVAGSTLYEVSSAGVKTARGTLLTTTGAVWMRWGLTQLVIVDGANGYTLTLGSNVFAQITSDAFYGSSTVSYLNGYFGFVRPDTQQFYVTAIDDASTLDALDFVSAERVPDGLVGAIDDHGQIIMFGSLSIEIWDGYSSSTFPYQRNNGASIEVGCMAAHSIRQADNGVFFIGRDKNGAGMVYRLASVTQPIRVSTVAVEEALAASTDLSQAVAWVYQERGLTFYCLQAPGVDSTWCYEISTGQWHERADIDGLGEFEAWRVDHCVFSHGKHLVGGSDGILYEMSREFQDFAGDARVCERISPHTASPSLDRLSFSAFILDCTTGEGPQVTVPVVELSWSNDGGADFGSPVQRSSGAVGERFSRVVWRRLGSARNRVWKVRFADSAPFSIISAEIQ
jgi:hypothetical protein